MSQTVTTRTFLWSEVVAQAQAVDALETAGNPFPLETAPWVYEFSNGTRKVDRANPYE